MNKEGDSKGKFKRFLKKSWQIIWKDDSLIQIAPYIPETDRFYEHFTPTSTIIAPLL